MLEICGLTKVYKGNKEDKVAVNNLSLKVEAGDIYGFIGHNGAGKSTTIKSVVGLMDFDKGDIFINGMSIKKMPLECKKIMAYIPDNPDIYGHLTGIQYLNMVGDIFKVKMATREELIEKYSTMFEIKANLGDLISTYSHGMKQKLTIISALIHSPKLIVMDEPFVGLDPKASYVVKTIMKNLCENGVAIFFSTHVLEIAEKLCNKVAIIKNGSLLVEGKTEDIVGNSSLEEVFLLREGDIVNE